MATQAPVDPYAAIRNLKFNYDAGDAGTPGMVDSGESQVEGMVGYRPSSWNTDFNALRSGGFQSKYNSVSERPDGTLAVTMQRPGMHKYDTMEAIYGKGADGQWTLQNDPDPTRQKGSGSLSKMARGALMDLGLNERYARGLTSGPGSSAALIVGDISNLLKSAGVGGIVGRINKEVSRNAEKDIYDNARATSRAAAVASLVGGGAALAAAMGGGVAGAAGAGAVMGGASQAEGSGKDIIKGAVTGGALAAVGAAGQRSGFSRPVTSAATSAARTAIRGGDMRDVLTSGATSALTSYGNQSGLTGNAILDRGLTSAAGTALRGGDMRSVLTSGAIGAFRSLGGATSNTTGGDTMPTDSYDINDFPTDPGNGYDINDFPQDPGNDYFNPGDYGNEGNNYPSPDSTQGRGGSPANAGDSRSWFGVASNWLQSRLTAPSGGTGGTGGTGGGMGNNWLRDALGLAGAGVNQWNIERVAKDDRDWRSAEKDKDRAYTDRKETERRARQAPVNVGQGSLSVFRKG